MAEDRVEATATAADMEHLRADWKEAMFELMYRRIHHLEGRIAKLEGSHTRGKRTLGHIAKAVFRRFRKLTDRSL